MNLFFDEETQKLIVEAKKEMYELKHPYVGSEHLLLAILKNENLEVTKSLLEYGINYDLFKKELIQTVGLGTNHNEWFLFTPLLKRIITNATYYSKNQKQNVTPYHLFLSILQEGDGVANRILMSLNIDLFALYEQFLSMKELSSRSTPLLDTYGVNMNEKCFSYDPVIGREKEISRMIQILLRKNKNNPILIGDAGVGKTAVVEELARRIQKGDVPTLLKNKVIYSVPMSSLVSGTKYRGEFEEKIHKLLSEVIENQNIILFIDEVHTLMGAGGAEGAIDASNILKPYLARGDLKIIGATTPYEYSKYMEKDKALTRRFQRVFIEEANEELVKSIFQKLVPIYEEYHSVVIPNKVLEKLINLSFYSVFQGKQPDKAIDLLDEVCAYASLKKTSSVRTLEKYEKKLLEWKEKKNEKIMSHEFQEALVYREKELSLQKKYDYYLLELSSTPEKREVTMSDLEEIVLARDRAPSKREMQRRIKESSTTLESLFPKDFSLDSFLSVFQKYNYFSQKKPLSILFVGKSDSKVTFSVEEVVKNLFPSSFVLSLSMKEYSRKEDMEKLIGFHYQKEEKGILSEIWDHPFTILLLDDFDQAHPSISQMFLQALESGEVTLANGKKISLSKCIVFLTTSTPNDSLGFTSTSTSLPETTHTFFLSSLPSLLKI